MKKRDLNFYITALFFILIGIYFYFNKDAFNELLEVPLYLVLLLGFVKTIRLFVTGGFTYYTVNALGKKIDIKKSSYLSLTSSMGNFLGPLLGGASVRAIYLKKEHKLEYSKFLSTLYIYYIITFASISLLGLITLVTGYEYYLSSNINGINLLLIFMLAVLLGCVVTILVSSHVLKKLLTNLNFVPKRVKNIINLALEGWDMLRSNRRLLFKLFMISLIVLFLAIVETLLLFSMLVDDFNIKSVILYTVIGTFTMLISLTPSAIGIKEGVFIILSTMLFLTPEMIIQIATVDRLTTFATLTMLFVFTKIFYKNNSRDKI